MRQVKCDKIIGHLGKNCGTKNLQPVFKYFYNISLEKPSQSMMHLRVDDVRKLGSNPQSQRSSVSHFLRNTVKTWTDTERDAAG
jgi:hypothetical protein